MEESTLTPTQGYQYDILNAWKEIYQLGVEFRVNYLNSSTDKELLNQYVAHLTRIFGDIYPEVEFRTDGNFPDLNDEMKVYHAYFLDPEELIKKTLNDPQVLFKMEATIRKAMRMLRLTNLQVL